MRQLHAARSLRFLPLLLAGNAASASAQIVANGGFESPALPGGTYLYNSRFAAAGVSPVAWTYTGNSGIIRGAGTGFDNPGATEGAQLAFLQFGNAASAGRIAQSITLPTAGTFRLTFDAAGRFSSVFTGNTEIDVLLGGATIATFQTTTSQPFTVRSFDFASEAGTFDLAFQFDAAQPDGDNTAFIDDVAIEQLAVTTTPEPASLALLGAGVLALGGLAARRRS